MGPPCSSFPWPNAQRWRNILSCDVRLIHAAVFENFFVLKPKGAQFGWLRQDPGRRLGAASTARLASFAEKRRSTRLRGVGRCPSVRLPVFQWRFCRNNLLRMLCSPECPSFRVLLLQEPPCCKFQACVAGYTDACTSLCTGAKHLRSAQFGRLFCSDTPPCNPLPLLLSLAKCAALEEHSEL